MASNQALSLCSPPPPYTHNLTCYSHTVPSNHARVGDLRFVGAKEEDGILVGWRFHSAFWEFIDLQKSKTGVRNAQKPKSKSKTKHC